MSERHMRVLIAGTDEVVQSLVRSEVVNGQFRILDDRIEFESQTEDVSDLTVDLIVCGPAFGMMSAIELAQFFKTVAPGAQVIMATSISERRDFRSLKKNGFAEVFLLPADDRVFAEYLRSITRDRTGARRITYKSVPTTDFVPGSRLDFSLNVYLPLNGRHVKIINAGDILEERKLARIKSHHVTILQIDEAEMPNFLAYSAGRLKDLDAESATNFEVKLKFQGVIRNLYRDILGGETGDFTEGRSLMDSSQQIVANFIAIEPAKDVFEKLVGAHSAGEDTIYAQSLRISSLSALMSVLTGIGNPQDLAMAGLFHNLGKTQLPAELAQRSPRDLETEARKIFSTYPEMSLRMLQEKKMLINPDLQKIISQQLERADGKGAPRGLNHLKIEPATQLLQICMQVDDLTALRPGHPRLSIGQAIAEIERNGSVGQDVLLTVKKAILATGT